MTIFDSQSYIVHITNFVWANCCWWYRFFFYVSFYFFFASFSFILCTRYHSQYAWYKYIDIPSLQITSCVQYTVITLFDYTFRFYSISFIKRAHTLCEWAIHRSQTQTRTHHMLMLLNNIAEKKISLKKVEIRETQMKTMRQKQISWRAQSIQKKRKIQKN